MNVRGVGDFGFSDGGAYQSYVVLEKIADL